MKTLKLTFTVILMLLSINLFAQRVKGIVIDKTTYLPVANAFIGTPASKSISNAEGKFTLTNVKPGDTLRISSIGYKPFKLVVSFLKLDTLRCYISPDATVLSEVKIRAKRNAKADSLRNRREFASVFAYHGATIKDMFITRSPDLDFGKPSDHIHADKSTASILSINLLSVIDMLGKNKAPQSKLQKILLKDEDEEYVDRFFSPERVSSITNLKGDSLQNFMNQYHPDIKKVKKMSDYDMVSYIKKSYAEYVKSGSKQTTPLFGK
ncbi:carboxypeptidase-like regulatory domain-containing protein [Mucilaginibacter sp. SMC90]|uniref:carboxypeptidase-like regulatory domain-containing protein n=1 Tax=Mucilaginibacter sp. SMC90 TaxID=2929803 RepID=UPI001FB255FC|nr:carboxypeptidase-like regulatory domain-containing protein [Mucilaginibacter sp. SMC90]UOE51044.1 carboxypeptidase-like regulatory domain-containing protein [Mucilaginibacter sp. SMC90]